MTRRAPRRWWLGWLQLACAWVGCMLVCANAGLLLARGLDGDPDAAPAARRPVACAPAALVTSPVSTNELLRAHGVGKSPRCNGA